MSGKKWVSIFVGIMLCTLLFIASMNFFVDPFEYFKYTSGEYIEYPNRSTIYTRYIKAKYVQKYGKEYDAYVLGGSKSGALRTDKLQEWDGYNYYNNWLFSGNFREYKLYTDFIIDNTNVKKILLHISGPEVRRFNRESYGDVFVTPAVVTGDSEIKEVIKFLGKNIKPGLTKLTNNLKKDTTVLYPVTLTGEMDLGRLYGQMEEKGPESYAEKYVLYDYDESLEKLFYQDPSVVAINSNLTAMKQIRDKCKENDVELVVVIGATALTELYEYECEEYREYLREMVSIFGEVWDFSGPNPVTMNPYNFYNESHYNVEVGNQMIEIMSGKTSMNDFGILLTKRNIDQYLDSRQTSYENLKEEYDATGTIDLSEYTYEKRIH